MAKSLMIVGTASHVGKSILTTALCRILTQDGHRVAPFKAQNMSLNSAVTPSGREIGRAQAVQAEACGILPNEHMNPVLLKPTGNMASQIVLQGRPVGTWSARDYFYDDKDEIWDAVVESYQYLAAHYDVVVLEGAGSPVEMNLKSRDIANIRSAEMADAPVILIADIDRGGVFASIVGTMALLETHERDRVRGIVINKFRGDIDLFDEGRQWLEAYLGIPVLGVIPYIPDVGIDEEDALGLATERYQKSSYDDSTVRIGIVQLPYMSNFTDFDPLFLEPDVQVYFCTKPEDLLDSDVMVLPGTKSTLLDLAWLHEHGWVDVIKQCIERGTSIIGICGGYQMLGKSVHDPHRLESSLETCSGLGIWDMVTTIAAHKTTVRVRGTLTGVYSDIRVEGYEIHMGVTEHQSSHQPFALTQGTDSDAWSSEGVISVDGRMIGTYLHGILHNDSFRNAWLNRLRQGRGLPLRETATNSQRVREAALDRLANTVRAHLNMGAINDIVFNLRVSGFSCLSGQPKDC